MNKTQEKLPLCDFSKRKTLNARRSTPRILSVDSSSPCPCLPLDHSAGRPRPGSLHQRTPSGGSSLRSPHAGNKHTSEQMN